MDSGQATSLRVAAADDHLEREIWAFIAQDTRPSSDPMRYVVRVPVD
jgi:hypothetical protein